MNPDQADNLRLPPQSVAAEQAVVGGLMLVPDTVWQIKGWLKEGDFYRREHRLIFRAILELVDKGKPFDAVTLGEWFDAHGLTEQIGGSSYLIELASTTPSAANIRAYAEIVREKSMLRQLIEAGTKVVQGGFQPDGRSAAEVVAEAQQAIFAVTGGGSLSVKTAKELSKEFFEQLQQDYEQGEHETGLITGFEDLDEATGGLQPGDFIIVAARPGIGKTVLAMNIAERVALAGKAVAVWSLEMSGNQLARRMQSSQSRVPDHILKRPWLLEDEHWSAINEATKRLMYAKLRVLDSPDLTIDEFEGQAYQLNAQEPLSLIVVDYLGLMTPPKAERHELAMGEISRRTKKLAKRLGVPIIGIHQLNRSVESRASREPTMADLRDTGRFEQDADIIALLHRERYYDESAPDDCQLHLAKHRGGPTKRLGLASRLDISRFENYGGNWVPYAQRKKLDSGKSSGGFDDDGGRPRRGSGRDRAPGRDA